MRIPLCDLKAENDFMKADIDSAISRVINDCSFIMGGEVTAFEDEYAEYCGTKYCIGVSSATDGLALALMAAGIGKPSCVAVPDNTVTADVEAVKMCGAVPLFCDVCEDHACIDLEWVKNYAKNIRGGVSAIIVVHMYGTIHPDIEEIKKYCDDTDTILIEDCSHAHGAKLSGVPVGSWGHAAVYSFFPSKVLGCFGDGGAVTTNDPEIAKMVGAMRNHGRVKGEKYQHSYNGFNMRLDGLQAAILRVKLQHLDDFVLRRMLIAENYDKEFCVDRKNKFNPHYVYTIRDIYRDELVKYLRKLDIQTGIHYPVPLHRQPCYSYTNQMEFPISEMLSEQTMSIPMFPFMTRDQQEYVIDSVLGFEYAS